VVNLRQGIRDFFVGLGAIRSFYASAFIVLILAAIDYLTGFELSFSFFYLIPIALATMYSGFRNGIVITAASIILWFLSNWLAGQHYSSAFVWVWNGGIRFISFIIIAYLIHGLNLELERENILARTDVLTGILNSREFYRLAALEVERARRYSRSVSVAYMDLDNFKEVNDRLGHLAGDELLRQFVETVRSVIRKDDLFARVGGDEFILLLPETNPGNIQSVIEKIRSVVQTMLNDFPAPMTVSAGVVTFMTPPTSLDVMVRSADEIMYQVKAATKNSVRYIVKS